MKAVFQSPFDTSPLIYSQYTSPHLPDTKSLTSPSLCQLDDVLQHDSQSSCQPQYESMPWPLTGLAASYQLSQPEIDTPQIDDADVEDLAESLDAVNVVEHASRSINEDHVFANDFWTIRFELQAENAGQIRSLADAALLFTAIGAHCEAASLCQMLLAGIEAKLNLSPDFETDREMVTAVRNIVRGSQDAQVDEGALRATSFFLRYCISWTDRPTDDLTYRTFLLSMVNLCLCRNIPNATRTTGYKIAGKCLQHCNLCTDSESQYLLPICTRRINNNIQHSHERQPWKDYFNVLHKRDDVMNLIQTQICDKLIGDLIELVRWSFTVVCQQEFHNYAQAAASHMMLCDLSITDGDIRTFKRAMLYTYLSWASRRLVTTQRHRQMHDRTAKKRLAQLRKQLSLTSYDVMFVISRLVNPEKGRRRPERSPSDIAERQVHRLQKLRGRSRSTLDQRLREAITEKWMRTYVEGDRAASIHSWNCATFGRRFESYLREQTTTRIVADLTEHKESPHSQSNSRASSLRRQNVERLASDLVLVDSVCSSRCSEDFTSFKAGTKRFSDADYGIMTARLPRRTPSSKSRNSVLTLNHNRWSSSTNSTRADTHVCENVPALPELKQYPERSLFPGWQDIGKENIAEA